MVRKDRRGRKGAKFGVRLGVDGYFRHDRLQGVPARRAMESGGSGLSEESGRKEGNGNARCREGGRNQIGGRVYMWCHETHAFDIVRAPHCHATCKGRKKTVFAGVVCDQVPIRASSEALRSHMLGRYQT